jgi:hypothetical protein
VQVLKYWLIFWWSYIASSSLLAQRPMDEDARRPLAMLVWTWWWLAEPWSSKGWPSIPPTGMDSMPWPCLSRERHMNGKLRHGGWPGGRLPKVLPPLTTSLTRWHRRPCPDLLLPTSDTTMSHCFLPNQHLPVSSLSPSYSMYFGPDLVLDLMNLAVRFRHWVDFAAMLNIPCFCCWDATIFVQSTYKMVQSSIWSSKSKPYPDPILV